MPETRTTPPPWRALPVRATAFRLAHIAWGVVAMSALAHVWVSAARRKPSPSAWAAVAFLGIQGVALLIGRGDCPFGNFQRRLGDPVPMFELILPPRAAKAAIPVLFVVSLARIVALIVRTVGQRPARQASRSRVRPAVSSTAPE